MLSWAEFEAAAPEIAARGRERFAVGYAFIGTTSQTGGPRVHPVTPLINGGRLFVFIGKHTVKFRNLRRDNRYAMHAILGEKDEEFLILGEAVPADDPGSEALAWEAARAIGMTSKDHVLMEFMVESAHWAVWEGLGTPDIQRLAKSWRSTVAPA
jgi:hypothetical protein